MQNRTGLAGLGLGNRLLQLLKTHARTARLCGAALGGFVTASSYLFGGAAPFGVAFCAAFGPPYAFSAGLGAVVGYTFSASPLVNMRYLAAVVLVMALHWLFPHNGKAAGIRSALSAFTAMAVAGAATLITSDATLYDVFLTAAEVCAGAGAAYFFSRSLAAAKKGADAATRSDISCLVVSFAVLVMGLSAIKFGTLSLGRILAALVVLLCARASAEAGGAVAGITAGVTMGLCTGDWGYAVAAYGFGGLLAGVFSGLGRIATAASFIIINALAALFTQPASGLYTALFEVFIASLLFSAIPQSAIARLRTMRRDHSAELEAGAQGALQGRLIDTAVALRDIGATTKEVGARLGKMESSSPDEIYSRVAERVCAHCGMQTACWQFRYNDTMNAMNDAMLLLRKQGTVSRGQMAKHFAESCAKLDDFVSELNAQFQAQVSRESVQRKVAKVRGVMADQFEGLALLLEELSGELCGTIPLDSEAHARVRDYFAAAGFLVQQVRCHTNEYERISVEVSFPAFELPKFEGTQAALDLSGLLEAEFDLPYTAERGKLATVLFTEKATLTAEMGAFQIRPEGNRLCGDAYESIPSRAGRAEFILSDGMGSGGGAAVDSHMASGLFSRLLHVGFGHEAALKMINSALLIKSGEESLATIDICSLDLYTGRATFYKAGAAPSFIVREGRAGYIESTSLPAGILQGVAFDRSTVALRAGDVIVMVSDGVTATGTDWIKSELPALVGGDMQRLAEKLAMTAKVRRTDGHDDDITVLAIALHKGI